MANEILERLKDGARRFQVEIHAGRAAEYLKAATTPQQPHTLVIACADSRVDVESITSSGPGEVFITRNIGNMVPAYGEMLGGVSAVIEYAVSALKVKSWLTNGQAALKVASSVWAADEPVAERLPRLTEENVLMQMAHLKTHPSVAGAVARKDLTISGWVYDIGTGEIRVVEDGQREFVQVSGEVSGEGQG